MEKITFYGHEVYPRGWSYQVLTFGGAIPYYFLLLVSIQHGYTILFWFSAIFAFITYPYPAYMVLELRHLFTKDGVADDFELPAIIVISLISAIHFVGMIFSIVITLHCVSHLMQYEILTIFILSFLAAAGALFGFLGLPGLAGVLFPPVMIYFLYKIISNRQLVFLLCLLTLLFGSVSLVVNTLYF